MKKIILSVAAVFAFGFANAQEEVKEAKGFGFAKGDIFVEGQISFSSENNKNTEVKTNSLNFSPKAGYFLTDKIAVGLQVGLGSSKTENYTSGAESETKTNSIDFGVFGRYYFLDLGQRFKTYTEAGLNYKTEGGESTSGGVTVKNDDFNTVKFGLGLGMNYFVTEKMAISFGLSDVLGFKTAKSDASGAKAVNNFNADLNVFNNFFDTPTFSLLYKF